MSIRTDRFKKQLETTLAELRQSLAGGAEAAAPVQLDTSIGRLSRMDAMQSQQMALGLRARQQQAVQRIEKALQAIQNPALNSRSDRLLFGEYWT